MTARLSQTFETNPDLFEVFALAETLGKTVDHLLTGIETPISPQEVIYWRYYFRKKRALEDAEIKKSSKSPKDSSEPRMMGRQG